MHICVFGAGIAGLAAAYELQREGHEITVVDQAAPGSGASAGNGAQLSYSYVQPLADPSLWRQLPRLLLAADSPLKLRPRLDPAQWAWGLRFLAACQAHRSRRTTALLLQLAAESREGFEQMLRAERLDCDFSTTGKLVLYRDAAALAAARRQVALQQALGSRQEVVTAERCLEIEPALGHSAHAIAGAVHTPSECAADCRMVCAGLAQVLRQRGARFELGARIGGLVRDGRRIAAARTDRGDLEADAFVVSLGHASAALARAQGLPLPVYPLKGYSITLALEPAQADAAPRVSITDSARKVVFARLGTRLRVAGMAELGGDERAIPAARIDSLRAATQALFPQCGHPADVQPWAGLRPATPTGLPVTGRLAGAPGNLLFHTGHGALGFTLAFGTARRLVRLLDGAPAPGLRPA
ncbi:D-amino acid dehydrogenase [Variovorax terrae]|uniref:D-amino acid dehydrogenase n=1 Tax=Variovorax terrae TaxID=2923278 RepID=A0A9X1VV26_9BURK|nr:D-amino acid dehydrogenase [Variovorax terrae]MCJ0762392.1 D-amino acid dehydrogenase [Variovorax terrae]